MTTPRRTKQTGTGKAKRSGARTRKPAQGSKRQTTNAKIIAAGAQYADRWQRWNTSEGRELLNFYTGSVALCVRLNSQNTACQQYRLFTKDAAKPIRAPQRILDRYKSAEVQHRKASNAQRRWLTSGAPGRKVGAYSESANDLREITSHPVLDLIGRPNPRDDGFEFWSMQLAYEELIGQSFTHPVFDDGVTLWPMFAQYVTPQFDDGGNLVGWLYGRQEPRQFFPTDEVLHKRFEKSLFRPEVGDSPLRSAFWESSMMQSMTTHVVNLFKRGARPDAHLSYPDDPTPEQKEEIRAAIDASFGSSENWFSWLITGGGAEFNPIGWSPKELDYNQSRKDVASEIAGIFGVPESMLRLNDANLASATAGHAAYMRYTILPRCVRLQDWMTQNLLPLFGLEPGRFFFAVDNPVPQDESADRLNIRADVQAGILTINEGRMALGYEPLGDEFDVPMVNGIPAGQRPEPVNPFAGLLTVTATETKAVQSGDADDHDMGAGASPEDRRKQGLDEAGRDHFANRDSVSGPEVSRSVGGRCGPERHLDYSGGDGDRVRGPDCVRAVSPHSHRNLWLGHDRCGCKAVDEGDPSPLYPEPPASLIVGIESFFATQRDAILQNMQRSAGQLSARRPAAKDDIAAREARRLLDEWGVTDIPFWTDQLARVVRDETDRRLIAAAVAGIAQINEMLPPESRIDPQSFRMTNERAVAFVDRYTAGLLDGLEDVNRTTAEALAASISEGIREGDALATLQNRVRVAFDDTTESGLKISEYRAYMIARTETARAQVGGTLAGWADTDVVAGRKWLLAPSACEFCEAAAKSFADTPVPLGESFYKRGSVLTGTDGGTMRLDFTDVDGAPLHPNCRCAVVPVLRTEV